MVIRASFWFWQDYAYTFIHLQLIINNIVVANVLDCGIIESEFKLQLHCYFYFQTNVFRKGMNPISPWPIR